MSRWNKKTTSGSATPWPPHKYTRSPAEAMNGEALADGGALEGKLTDMS